MGSPNLIIPEDNLLAPQRGQSIDVPAILIKILNHEKVLSRKLNLIVVPLLFSMEKTPSS